jgi:hypothetical protein
MTMTPFLRLALVITTVLVAMPAPAFAAPPPILEARATAIAFSSESTLDGRLGAFHSAANPDDGSSSPATAPSADRAPPAEMRITAAHIRIETDVEGATGSPLVNAPQRQPTEGFDVTDARAGTIPARQGFTFFVAPREGHAAPSIEIELAPAALQPQSEPSSEAARHVPTNRPVLQGAPAPSLAPGDGTVRWLRISGDFAISLWEWDMKVSNETSAQTVRSGYTYQRYAPPVAGVDTVGRYEERQVFLYADAGELEATLPVGAAAGLEFMPTAGAVAGRMTLSQPDGHVDIGGSSFALRDGDWVEGGLQLAFAGLDDHGFLVRATGAPTAASAGGHLVPMLVAAAPATSGWLWLALLLVPIAVGAVGAWQLSVRHGLRKIQASLAASDYTGVVKAARPSLLRLPRRGDSVRTQLAVALLLLGRPADAAKTLAGWKRGHPATRDYLWACVHAAQGEAEQAVARIDACMAADPEFARHLLADPLLHRMKGPAPSPPSGLEVA